MRTAVGRGMTIIEILVVVAIIATLAAILFPVFAGARKSAHRTQCISNLHQCTSALLMYYDDNGGGMSLPTYDQARVLLAKAPTCDLEDTFRAGCSQPSAEPLIGSYAYLRGVADYRSDAGLTKYLADRPNPYLMACTFYGDSPKKLFTGLDSDPCVSDGDCWMPSRLVRSRMDGGVEVRTLASVSTGARSGWLFTWPGVFEHP
jgi:prepilin-type N-terminal cleavage/methylation domain-containing protein